MKTQRNLPKSNKKIITKSKHQFPNKFSIYPSYKYTNWNICFNSKFYNTKGISKKLQPLRKGPYQIIDKPTDVTYKITYKRSFNIETIFYLTTQKSTHFENLLNCTLLQDLKSFKTVQNKIIFKTLICKLYKST